MTNEEMQKFGKDSVETMMSSFGMWSKSAQAIAVESRSTIRRSRSKIPPPPGSG